MHRAMCAMHPSTQMFLSDDQDTIVPHQSKVLVNHKLLHALSTDI